MFLIFQNIVAGYFNFSVGVQPPGFYQFYAASMKLLSKSKFHVPHCLHMHTSSLAFCMWFLITKIATKRFNKCQLSAGVGKETFPFISLLAVFEIMIVFFQ